MKNVSVIGTGYVGLVTAVGLANLGHQVRAFEADKAKRQSIQNGQMPFYEPGLPELVKKNAEAGRFVMAESMLDAAAKAEVIFIAVGTPDKDGQINLSYVEAACRELGAILKEKKDFAVVTIKSTVVPGTTWGPVRQWLEESSGRKAGVDFGLAMNPEFLREGTAVKDFIEPDRIVIGTSDPRASETLSALYAPFNVPIITMTPTEAEFTKYTSNSLLATLVSFSNEIAGMIEATPNADSENVFRGLHADRRFRVTGKGGAAEIVSYILPGGGYGGSCLPKDVAALSAFARGRNVPSPLLDAVATVNAKRAERVLTLAEKDIGSLAGKKVALLGLAFKPETDDLRSTPALSYAKALAAAGAKVVVFDPYVNHLLPGLDLQLSKDAASALADASVGVIATAHPEFRTLDWAGLGKSMAKPVLLDTRRALTGVVLPDWMIYRPIGRAA